MIPHTRTAHARAPAPEAHMAGGQGRGSSPLLRPTLTEETVRQHGPHHSSDFSLSSRAWLSSGTRNAPRLQPR